MTLITDLRRAFEPDLGRAITIALAAARRERARLTYDARDDARDGAEIDARQRKVDRVVAEYKAAHSAKHGARHGSHGHPHKA